MPQPPDPWQSTSFPQNGDVHDIATYAGVGRVLSQWEEVEVRLGAIYTILTGQPDDVDAFREYGIGRIFVDRVKTFERAACAFFIPRPNQRLEGRIHDLLREVKRLSDKRNEVAHGIVRPIQWMRARRFDDPPGGQFVLVPSHYNKRKFTRGTLPDYAYTSVELHSLEMELFEVRKALAEYDLTLRVLLNL
jgi:hypothetical protein